MFNVKVFKKKLRVGTLQTLQRLCLCVYEQGISAETRTGTLIVTYLAITSLVVL